MLALINYANTSLLVEESTYTVEENTNTEIHVHIPLLEILNITTYMHNRRISPRTFFYICICAS